MSARACRSLLLPGLLSALCLAAALAPAPAPAAQVEHQLETTFDGADAPGGPFQFVFGLAVDSSGGVADGDVYVAEVRETGGETLDTRIYRFGEDGAYAGVEFDGSDTPAGSFSFVSPQASVFAADGLAVDSSAGPSSGKLYVGDVGNGVVDLFDENGHYVCQITGTATPSPSECAGLAGSATPAGGFVPGGVEVDATNGDLYVTDVANKIILRFDDSGQFVGQISDPHLTQPGPIAVDPTGAIYVANGSLFFPENVVKFAPGGAFDRVVDAAGPVGVAVDGATGTVLVPHNFGEGSILEYDPAGNLLSSFGAGGGESAYLSLAVNPADGRIYGGNFGFLASSVDVYSPDTVVPDVSADPAGAVAETTATLSGHVDPAGGGDVVSCRFEYGTTTAYGKLAPCIPAAPYASPTDVSVDLSGLDPSTTYHFRLAAANGGVAPYTKGVHGHSADGVFVTEGPPTVDEQSVSGIERTAATLQAKINPHGHDTEFRFEFVDAAHFEEAGYAGPATRSTQLSQIGDGLKPLAVNQGISGLAVGTTYHFRAVATNSHGTVTGPDATFTTLPVVRLEDQWAYAHLNSATLEARVDPLGLATTCRAQYVTDRDFQLSGFEDASSLPCLEDLGPVSSPRTVKAEVGGLQHSTTYRFRFAFENESGTLIAPEESFPTFGIESFSMKVVDAEGNPHTQAGGHPYESITRYSFNHTFVAAEEGEAGSLNGFIKEVITEQPVGRVNSTVATPRCKGYLVDEQRCDKESQIGTVIVEYFEEGSTSRSTQTRALYNAYAPTGAASRYASVDPYTASDARLRTGGDYGVTARDFNVSEEARVVGVTARIWGVPGDPRHDKERCPGQADGCPSEVERKPLLRNPTSCAGPLVATARVNTWQSPDEYSTASSEMPATSGCDKVEFDPSVEWRPTTEAADSPSGLRIKIHVPQNEDPDENSVADLKDAKFTLSEGLILNPSAANGLVGCTSRQADIDGEGPARCPDASKIGLVTIRTPLLDHPVHGGIYVAEPRDNPFDSLFAIYLALHDPETGIVVKLAGEIEADARDGQLRTSFLDNPQLPVEDFELEFFGGPRGMLRTPVACGTYETTAELTPWSAPASGPPAIRSDSYRIATGPNGRGCVGSEADAPSAATVHAGTVDPVAGAYTPFVLHLRREDGTQQIADLRIDPPRGLLGRLARLGRCPEAALDAAASRSGRAELAAPSCPAQAEVGRVEVGAGAGPMPYYVPGKAYLAGPHRGAPLSLAVVVPAVAGPFDLGTVVVRAGLHVDLESGQIRVESEPLPAFLEGVSLDVRSIDVRLDRPRFIVNPTRCAPMTIGTSAISPFGHTSTFTEPFQVGRCNRLPFAPRLGMRLFGNIHRGAHPSLRTVLRMPEGSVNLAAVSVTLPPTQFLDQTHLRGICTREQFAAEACPPDSVYGHAKAWSPLLDAPLRGPVYLRSSNRRLPNLVADLRGEFRFALDTRIDTARGGIRTSVRGTPDAPVTKFVLKTKGDGQGLLQNSTNVCRDPRRALVELEAQDGRVKMLRPLLAGQCPGGDKGRGGG